MLEKYYMMNKNELLRRYLIFAVSLFIIAFGISIVTHSNLGTSPISSIPYVASLNTPISLGVYFFALTIVLIALQMLMLGKKGIIEQKVNLLMQIPVGIVLSIFTDLTMWMLRDFDPDLYIVRIITLIIGCIVLALGICFEVIADVTMISGEFTVQAIVKRFKKDFGFIKVIFDITLVLFAVLCSWVMVGRIEGVREGTIIAALITGPFVRLIMPYLTPIRLWLKKSTAETAQYPSEASTIPLVITISREYGSGGHEIGRLIAEQMDFDFYDQELISLVAKESGFSEEIVTQNEQRIPISMLYQMIMKDYEAPLDKSLSYDDALFVAQSKVILRIASKKPCVIVGRCADYILKGRSNTIKIFLYADMTYKTGRVINEYGVSLEKAPIEIANIDKSRKEHYFYYTGQRWSDARNYTVSFDTGVFSSTRIVNLIKDISINNSQI